MFKRFFSRKNQEKEEKKQIMLSSLYRKLAQNAKNDGFDGFSPVCARQPIAGVGRSSLSDSCAMSAAHLLNAGYAETGSADFDFIGFQALSSLSQIPEIRAAVDAISSDALREWGEVSHENPEVKEFLTNQLKKLNARKVFRDALVSSLFYGGSMVLMSSSLTDNTNVDEKLPLSSESKVKKLIVIDGIYANPISYDTTNPLSPAWYNPDKWYLMTREVHHDHLLHIVPFPVVDMIKPMYQMHGISLTQVMWPYVRRWHNAVESSADLLKSYSVSGIKTDMMSSLQDEDLNAVIMRAELFNKFRDNRGLLLLNKETEEFFQFSTPLSGIADLVRQTQEQMSAVARVPLVKLLGITPSGLNASSDGEIKVYYDFIAGIQDNCLLPLIQRLLSQIEMSEFGTDDADFVFNPLMSMSEREEAEIQEIKSRMHVAYASVGAASSDDIRGSLDAEERPIYPEVQRDDADEFDELIKGLANGKDNPPSDAS